MAAGLTVGDWLSELIVLHRKSHTADEGANLPALPSKELVELVSTMNERLTAIEEQRSRPILQRLLGRQKAA